MSATRRRAGSCASACRTSRSRSGWSSAGSSSCAPRACASSSAWTSAPTLTPRSGGRARTRPARPAGLVIATGSRVPLALPVPGRELDGVHFAMDYLYDRARVLDGNPPANPLSAAGKHVLVVGGGDTGADCVGHAHREGAASVTQIELLGEPPKRRPDDLTPWPRWPVKLRTSYALKEGGERDFAISTTQLIGNGRVQEVHWVQNSGKPPFEAIEGTEESHPVELVLLAMGFLYPEQPLLEALGVERDQRGNAKAGAYATSAE